jgi:hypothetical protein
VVLVLHLDININGGDGENVLHIAARSQNIWKDEDVSFILKTVKLLFSFKKKFVQLKSNTIRRTAIQSISIY